MSINRKHLTDAGTILACFVCLSSSGAVESQNGPSPKAVSPGELWSTRGCADDQRGKWFRDAKFGAFIHFGPYSQLGGYWKGNGPYRPAEQIIGLGERHALIPPEQYREEVAGVFNPTNFNAEKWVSAIKRAGQRYVIVTTKHHDGFCMFGTKTTTYNVVDSTPFGRDVVQELAAECRRQGIVFCPYYSIGDWCAESVQKPEFQSYHDYMFAQLKELLTNYGDIRLLWFDNYWYVNNQWENNLDHAQELYDYVRSFRPMTLVNDRCGRGVSSTDGDYATPENQLKGSRQSRYFEVVMTNTEDDNWGWVRTATNYRKPATLIQNLIDCTSKGGNFVLNVGPTASGEFPPEHLAILDAMGSWLNVNGEAIYGCDPAPECTWDESAGLRCFATKNSKALYLHIVNWPDGGKPLEVHVSVSGSLEVTALDPSLPPLQSSITPENGALNVSIQPPTKPALYATVIKLTISGLRTDQK